MYTAAFLHSLELADPKTPLLAQFRGTRMVRPTVQSTASTFSQGEVFYLTANGLAEAF